MDEPRIAGKEPEFKKLEKGQTYKYCTCGLSLDGIWCDAEHKGTKFKPLVFTSEKAQFAAICTCKRTKTPPYCDGAHTQL